MTPRARSRRCASCATSPASGRASSTRSCGTIRAPSTASPDMNRSDGRILTTHVGSLPRPLDLLSPLAAKDAGEPYDKPDVDAKVRRAVAATVARQAEIGIDIVNDGEQSKSSFSSYARTRLSGLTRSDEPAKSRTETRDTQAFPAVYAEMKVMYGARHADKPGRRFVMPPLAVAGPIAYTGQAELA